MSYADKERKAGRQRSGISSDRSRNISTGSGFSGVTSPTKGMESVAEAGQSVGQSSEPKGSSRGFLTFSSSLRQKNRRTGRTYTVQVWHWNSKEKRAGG